MRRHGCMILLSLVLARGIGYGEIRVLGEPEVVAGGEGVLRAIRPVWSPDGNRIAFTSPHYRGLWVLNREDGSIVQVSDEPSAGFGFQWSSDSRAIVGRTAEYSGRYRYNRLKVFDLSTNTSRPVGEARTLMTGLPRWADGDRKILLPGRRRLEIYESGHPTATITKGGTGAPILVQMGDRIAVGNLETGAHRKLDVLEGSPIINLTVSRDGTKAAFEVVGGNMFIMNADGTGLVDLGRGHRPQWGPEGEYLVYMITEDDGYRYLSSDLFVIRIDGGEKTPLTRTEDRMEMNPSWSPDGGFIAFDVMEEGALYIMEVSR